MKIDFKPQTKLERAICDRDNSGIIYAIADDDCTLTALAPASALGDECFSDGAVFSVLLLAATPQQLQMMKSSWFRSQQKVSKRLCRLIDEALAPLPQEHSNAEQQLICAIRRNDNAGIIRLIEQENARFYSFAPEIATHLPQLAPAAALSLLRDGLSAKLQALIFALFIKETENPEHLANFTYQERIKYTNIMIKILTGCNISAETIWYPENINN